MARQRVVCRAGWCAVFASALSSVPVSATHAVSQRFLADIPGIEEGVRESIAHHVAFVHESVTEASLK